MDCKIYYSIPDFFNLHHLNMNLLGMMNKFPHMFRDNVVIDSIYGTFPGIIWNGGRVQLGHVNGYNNMVNRIEYYNKNGISVRYTFTNQNITERHFEDNYGNLALEAANELSGKYVNTSGRPVLNGVNVYVPEFGKYVVEKYPSLYQLWSTTREANSVADIDSLSENTLTVISYNLNNTEKIKELSHPENIEILCSETCVENCTFRQLHYKDISDQQMLLPNAGVGCPNGITPYYYENAPLRAHYISPDKIEEEYQPLGLNKFKLNGRGESFVNVIERYVIYLAKPEYKDIVRNYLLIGEAHNKII